MLARSLWLAGFLALGIYAESDSVVVLTGTESTTSTSSSKSLSYASIGSQITATDLYDSTTTTSSSKTTGSGSTTTGTGSVTSSSSSKGSTSTVTLLVGGAGLATKEIINGTYTTTLHSNSTATTSTTSTGTSSSAVPTNTQPCNNYPEFCARKYGNITEVCAHNGAFDVKGNAASNQDYGVLAQLNDGVRMVQGEVHWDETNNTLYNCHSSCDLLNTGTWLSELEDIAAWVEAHPYDVLTILIVNSVYAAVGNFSSALQASGLGPYLYEPPYIPMKLDQWPTLSEMILTQKRVVVFMDYEADQAQVPYILDEFTHMWETPFSPEDRDFPCTTQRPPNLNQTIAKDELMYIANHNLNVDVTLLGLSILVPNTVQINETNAAAIEYGSLGTMSQNCTAKWDRPPTFLLVDYYNDGDSAGSVFEVAARANNVTYNRQCCGEDTTSGAADVRGSTLALLVAFAAVFAFVV